MTDSPLQIEKGNGGSPHDTQSNAGKQYLNDVDPTVKERSPRDLHGVKVTRQRYERNQLR